MNDSKKSDINKTTRKQTEALILLVFKSVLMDETRKSIGNSTSYTSRGQTIMRKKKKPRNPRTLKQQKQRLRMKTLAKLGKVFAQILSVSFPGRSIRLNPENCFTSLNQKAVVVSDDLEVTVLYEQLQLGEDRRELPRSITAELDAENRTLTFTFGQQQFFRHAANDDMFYAQIVETGLMDSEFVPLCKRNESDPVTVSLPEGWDCTRLAVYVIAVANDGRSASKSRYMPLD